MRSKLEEYAEEIDRVLDASHRRRTAKILIYAAVIIIVGSAVWLASVR